MTYNPADWYWKKLDGSLYSSSRMLTVRSGDAAYEAWVEAGNSATPYPKDEDGAESEAELAAVLAVYGLRMSAPDVKVEAIERLTALCAAAIIGGYSSSALGDPHNYPSGVTDQINMMGSVTASLLPDLADDWATPFWCSDSAGLWAFRMHNTEQIRQAGSDGKAHIVTCQGTLDQLTAAVAAATTEVSIETIVWPQ